MPEEIPWYEHSGSPLGAWLAEMASRGWQVGRRYDGARQCVTLDVSDLPSAPFRLRIELPAGTPSVSPTVYGYALDLHLHQNPTEFNYCLQDMINGPVQAVEAVLRLHELASAGQEALLAESLIAAEPRSGFIAPARDRAVLRPVELPEGQWGTLTLRGPGARDRGWSWIDAITVGSDREPTCVVSPEPALRDQLRRFADSKGARGVWYRSKVRNYPVDRLALRDWWERKAPDEALSEEEQLVDHWASSSGPICRVRGVIVPEEGPGFGEWHERLLLVVENGADAQILIARPLPSSSDARIPGTAPLLTRTVAVAGCGMLGGHVAVDLTRSGLGSIRLADSGVVLPGNLVRQPYALQDLGFSKAQALGLHIAQQSPACLVGWEHLLPENLGTATDGRIRNWLDGVDLLVLTTGNRGVELYLNRIAAEMRIPVTGGFVRAGIRSGVVYGTDWGRSGCRSCLESVDENELGGPTSGDSLGVYPEGCGNPTFLGTEADGIIVASVLSRMAMAQLGAELSPPGGPLCVVHLADERGGFSIRTEWKDFPPRDGCATCEVTR